MRIAFLTNNLLPPREGIGQHVMALASRLRGRGHEIVVLSPNRSWRRWEEETVEGVTLRRFPWLRLPPLHHELAARTLGRWVAEGADGADLLHVHLPLLPPLAASLPTLVTVHSPMKADSAAITEKGMKPLLLRAQARLVSARLEQRWLDRADTVIAVSKGVARELDHGYRLRGRRVEVIANGVDTHFFTPAMGRRPAGGPILALGRLGVRKGLFRLLAAFAGIEDHEQRLVIAGEGPFRDRLAARAVELGVGKRVEFAGFLDREGVRAALREASCYVNPADYESGPLTLLEAMACGVPVVSTPTGLARELGPEAPIEIAEPTPAALRAGLEAVIADPDRALAKAGAARHLVASQFSWDRAVDAHERLYGQDRRAAA